MPSCDTIIRNATIIDGTRAPRFAGDLAIRGDRIAALGRLDGWTAPREVDATGLVAAPGFIDAHTHDDLLLLSDPSVKPKASQGVTTVIAGNCGVSLAPLVADAPPPPFDLIAAPKDFKYRRFGEYLEDLDAHPAALNAACLVGHSTLRAAAMDRLDRAASDTEIAAMRAVAVESVSDGAIGLSTGLYYAPANAAPTSEVIEICRPLRALGALYVTHMRDEAEGIIASLDETFAIGREAGIGAIVSHHKCAGLKNHGRSVETLPHIERAMARQPIALDCYPYAASSTVLRPDAVARSSKVIVTWSKARPDFAGMELTEIAGLMGCDVAQAVQRLQPAGAIYFQMSEEDVRRILAFPPTMIGSDGVPHDAHPHPRLWGTFPRVLGHYCRDEKLFDLETAIHKMTGLTARNFGLKDRGTLRPGGFADVTLFDPATVADRATFKEPTTPSAGIALVMVNGTPVWENGRATGALPGRALRRGRDVGPR
jgi:N-acyl-D-amino-acid deacylase